MNRRIRALLLLTAIAALGLAAVVVLFVVPPPETCPSFDCGDFRGGAVDVFGAGNFTLPQTIVIAVAIFVTAGFLARALIPERRWLSGGIAALALALAVGWSLPSRPVGPAPSMPCTTPAGPGGPPVLGRCETGPPPVDTEMWLRLLVIASGAGLLALAGARDASARSSRATAAVAG